MNSLIDNIRAYYLLSTLREKEQGLEWYKSARSECTRLAKLYSLNLSTVVGVLAALSPRNRWTRNVSDTEQVILFGEDATVGTFSANKTKATRILCGESPLDVLSGNKVRSFYTCIVDTKSLDCCIDSHAYAVALGSGERIKAKNISDNTYTKIKEAYQELAGELSLQPKQLQAITWLAFRRIHKIH